MDNVSNASQRDVIELDDPTPPSVPVRFAARRRFTERPRAYREVDERDDCTGSSAASSSTSVAIVADKRDEQLAKALQKIGDLSRENQQLKEELTAFKQADGKLTKGEVVLKNYHLEARVTYLENEVAIRQKRIDDIKKDYQERIEAMTQGAAQTMADRDRIDELGRKLRKLEAEKKMEQLRMDNNLSNIVKMMEAEKKVFQKDKQLDQKRIKELLIKVAHLEKSAQPQPQQQKEQPQQKQQPAQARPGSSHSLPQLQSQLQQQLQQRRASSATTAVAKVAATHPEVATTQPPVQQQPRPGRSHSLPQQLQQLATTAAVVQPVQPEDLPMDGHATNLFAPCNLRAPGALLVGRAVQLVREAVDKHGADHYESRCGQRTDIRSLCCALCDKTMTRSAIYDHFCSVDHVIKVRAACSAVSGAAHAHWLQLLMPPEGAVVAAALPPPAAAFAADDDDPMLIE